MGSKDYAKKVINFSKLRDFFNKNSREIVPAVAQDYLSGEILIIGHADFDALAYSIENKVAAFWSVSRNELWVKGKTSGNFLSIVGILMDCEFSSIIYLVNPAGGGSCHKKMRSGKNQRSCFFKSIKLKEGNFQIFNVR